MAAAQYNSNFVNYTGMGRSVSLNLEYAAGSNAMNSDLTNTLMWGGYINQAMKDRSAGKLKAYNNFGVNLNYDLNAIVKGGKKFDLVFGIKNQELTNGYFTRDFYHLLFYGNADYKGKQADLSNCSFNALRFQEFKFGAMMNKVDSMGKIGFSVSLLKGEQLFYLASGKNSSFYTSADGSEVTWNSDFNLALSDTSKKGLGSFNGVGASADIYFETEYKSKLGKRSLLIVNANNIGFIYWRKQSVQYSSDSVYNYKGYSVNDINDLRDTTLGNLTRDSIRERLLNNYSKNFNVNIPTNLILINKIYFGQQKFCFSFGFRHIFNANYIPYVFVEPEYRYRNFTFGFHSGYGGYTRLNVGLSAAWNSDGWFIKLGSNSLQGFLLPSKTSGQGIYLTLAKKLK
ncbi:MAG TPA: DUF5723 family protein [Bacteroidia bacterium]|nr:DUF5723 family protein [Bacteroidia bacterium]